MEFNFDDIRPYTNEEANEKIKMVVDDPVFDRVLMHLYKARPKIEMVKKQLKTIQTIEELQGTFIYDLLNWIINKTSDGLSCTGIEKLDKT